ncbi:MAG: IS630 family transposase, partial [Deltaproteobacteria bacterium]|nr:IS630 family transposase [Deltaproteobacteria bacterium]
MTISSHDVFAFEDFSIARDYLIDIQLQEYFICNIVETKNYSGLYLLLNIILRNNQIKDLKRYQSDADYYVKQNFLNNLPFCRYYSAEFQIAEQKYGYFSHLIFNSDLINYRIIINTIEFQQNILHKNESKINNEIYLQKCKIIYIKWDMFNKIKQILIKIIILYNKLYCQTYQFLTDEGYLMIFVANYLYLPQTPKAYKSVNDLNPDISEQMIHGYFPERIDYVRNPGRLQEALHSLETELRLNNNAPISLLMKKTGLSQSTVYVRRKDFFVKGYIPELNKRGCKEGERRKLSDYEFSIIKSVISSSYPCNFNLPHISWSGNAVKELTFELNAIDISRGTVSNYMHRNDCTSRKAGQLSCRQDPIAIRNFTTFLTKWHIEESFIEGGHLYTCDEVGFDSDPVNVMTYAPKNITATVLTSGTRFHTNAVCSISIDSPMRYMIYDTTMTREVFIKYMRDMIRSSGGKKIFMFVDNLRVHHSKAVQAFVSEHRDQIVLIYLPAYFPQGNPSEYGHNHVKKELGKIPHARSKEEFHNTIFKKLFDLSRNQPLIAKFFAKKETKYFLKAYEDVRYTFERCQAYGVPFISQIDKSHDRNDQNSLWSLLQAFNEAVDRKIVAEIVFSIKAKAEGDAREKVRTANTVDANAMAEEAFREKSEADAHVKAAGEDVRNARDKFNAEVSRLSEETFRAKAGPDNSVEPGSGEETGAGAAIVAKFQADIQAMAEAAEAYWAKVPVSGEAGDRDEVQKASRAVTLTFVRGIVGCLVRHLKEADASLETAGAGPRLLEDGVCSLINAYASAKTAGAKPAEPDQAGTSATSGPDKPKRRRGRPPKKVPSSDTTEPGVDAGKAVTPATSSKAGTRAGTGKAVTPAASSKAGT